MKEMPLLRAPENRRTGMEISPKVKWPDQTDDGIVPPQEFPSLTRIVSLQEPKSLNSTARRV